MNPPIRVNRSAGRWAEIWIVESESRPGQFYNVGRTKAGDYGCSCPQWKFKRSLCKHINLVMHHLAGNLQGQPAAVEIATLPAKAQAALSRFALIE